MLIMLFICLYCRWSKKDNSSQNFSAYFNRSNSCSGIEPLRNLKCNGSTFSLMKLHGRWWIRCGSCILHYLPVKAKNFCFGVWYMFGICFGDVFGIRTYVYGCKYHHGLIYKALIISMDVIWSCYHVLW